MRVTLVLISLLLALPAGKAQDRPGALTLSPGDLWIRNVTLVSPERDQPVPNRHVVVRNGRILAVSAATPRQAPAGVLMLDGGRLLFGSDTPSAPTFTNPPGYNGFMELQALEAAGIPARQLLAAATVENAKLFGLSRDYGTIEPGKIANMILLRADPLASVSAFDRIDTVIVKGRPIPRTTLAAGQ